MADEKTGDGGGGNMDLAMFRLDLNDVGDTGLHFQSRRSPVLGTKGVVASSQPLASQIGIQILNKGGNAVDGAVQLANNDMVIDQEEKKRTNSCKSATR